MIRSTITAQEFASLLGVSCWTLYKSVSDGTCPVAPIRVGRRMVWSTAQVADLLGVKSVDNWTSPISQSDGVGHDRYPEFVDDLDRLSERSGSQ